MILSMLLARQGVSTALLEAKVDFDRAFRGDTVHPSTLEMLDDLGLADPLLARDHGKPAVPETVTDVSQQPSQPVYETGSGPAPRAATSRGSRGRSG